MMVVATPPLINQIWVDDGESGGGVTVPGRDDVFWVVDGGLKVGVDDDDEDDDVFKESGVVILIGDIGDDGQNVLLSGAITPTTSTLYSNDVEQLPLPSSKSIK
ncbi:unnamed protein product [Orchesella dallaii]|uniref:Uncharacterized protein n=1 Tax=Orchesella dallaii TaxID=48710 RepID=A0ABP1QV19_9HEXA